MCLQGSPFLSCFACGPVLLLVVGGIGMAERLSAESSAVASADPIQAEYPTAGELSETPKGLSKSDWSGIRAAYEAGRHAFQPVDGKDGHWQAHNPGQQWVTRFDGRGFLASPRGGGWTWGLELLSYGSREMQTPVGACPPRVNAKGQRLSYDWDATVQEWWVNDPRGLEHGYVIAQRPHDETRSGEKEKSGRPTSDTASPNRPDTASSWLSLTLASRGNLQPKITADAQGVFFQETSGTTVVNYTGLKVWDADGKTLPSRFEAAGGKQVRLVVEDAGARYPVTIDPIAQQAYLKASGSGSGDYFGYSVAVSGDTVAVGAWQEDSNATGVNGNQANNSAIGAGAVCVFTRSGAAWIQQAYLKASNTGAVDYFGFSLGLSGDTLVVGAPGEDSNSTGVNRNQANNLAEASGAAYVFTRSGTAWTQQAYLKASNSGAEDFFGWSVTVSGDTVVVGAYGEDSNAIGVNGNQVDNATERAGAAYVFVRSGATWTQQAYLKAGNTDAGDHFGFSLAMSDNTVVVGAFQEDSDAIGVNSNGVDNSASNAGAAYVFVRNGTEWTQQAYLKAANTGLDDHFGRAVAVSGDTLVVGGYGEDSSANGVNGSQADNSTANAGAAYVFVRSGTEWTQQAYLKAGNPGVDDWFGASVAVSGETVIVGALGEDSNATGVDGNPADNSALDSGAAYVFTRSGTLWTQQAYLKANNTGGADVFGVSVAVSGDTVVVGAWAEDSNATGVNGNPADDTALDSGAAYVFTGLGPTLESWRQAYFGIACNSGHAADTFDYDRDGLANLLEWACHLSPTSSSVLPANAVRKGATLEFTYTRSVSALNAGTTYTVEWSDTLLGPDPWDSAGVTEEILSDNGTVQVVKATVPAGGSHQRFVRLKVTAP